MTKHLNFFVRLGIILIALTTFSISTTMAQKKPYATATPQLITEFFFIIVGAIVVAYLLKKRNKSD